MSCKDLTSVELKKILSDNDVTGRSKLTTKAAMCKVIEKLGLLSSKVKKPASSKIAVSKPARKAKSRKSTKKPAAKPKPRKSSKKPAKIQKAKKDLELVQNVGEPKYEAEEETKNDLELIHNLVARGFIPKHKSHEADEALKYLENIVKHFALTKQCVGNTDEEEWFKYLFNQEQFHPSLEISPWRLSFKMQLDDTLQVENQPFFLDQIRETVAKHHNTIIPLVITIGAENHSDESRHANMLLIIPHKKRFEWFEPHGHRTQLPATEQFFPRDKALHAKWDLETFMKDKLASLLNIPDYQFEMPYDECSYALGPQSLQKYDQDCPTGGFCLTYSTVYAHLRFLAPDATAAQTVQSLMNMTDQHMLDFIRRYVGWQNAMGISTRFTEEYRL
jgi:hypothetical protein